MFFLARFYPLVEPNPVFKRELRARWRRPAAYLTLFFYAVPLAFCMVVFYIDAFERMAISDKTPAERGKDLFDMLIAIQLSLWLFIGAIAAAPAIASERQRGSLEALQLANLSAWRIVTGKCFSLFSFEALLFLVPVPVVAICFLLGGVEPHLFAISALSIALTALCGTSIGLYFSSIRLRPGAALRDAIIFLLAWTAIAGLSTALSSTTNSVYLSCSLFIRRLFALIALPHPMSILRWMNDENFYWPARDLAIDEAGYVVWPGAKGPALIPGQGPLFDTVDAQTAWCYALVGLTLLSLLFFVLASRATARVFAEPEITKRSFLPTKKAKASAPLSQSAPAPTRARQILYNEISILGGRSFDNPIFGRELRGKLRWRAASPSLWLMRSMLIFVPLGFYCFLLQNNLSGLWFSGSPYALHFLALLNLLLLCLYAAVTGATAFTRERDSNTWEGLKLTLLQPGHILWGKIGPLILVLAVLSLPLCLALLMNIGIQSFTTAYGEIDVYYLPWQNAAMALAVVFSTSLAVGSIAFFLSWLARTTQVALGLSVAINAVWLGFFLQLSDSATLWDLDGAHFLSWWNPLAALQILIQISAHNHGYLHQSIYGAPMPYQEEQSILVLHYMAGFCPLVMLCVAAFFTSIIAALMRQKFRDEK